MTKTNKPVRLVDAIRQHEQHELAERLGMDIGSRPVPNPHNMLSPSQICDYLAAKENGQAQPSSKSPFVSAACLAGEVSRQSLRMPYQLALSAEALTAEMNSGSRPWMESLEIAFA